MMKKKQASSSSSSKRIVAVVDAALSSTLTPCLSPTANTTNTRNHCHVEVHDRPDPSLGIAINKATVQQCRSYLYIQDDRSTNDDKDNKNAATSTYSSTFSFCEIQAIPCDFGAFLLRHQKPESTTSSPSSSVSTTTTTTTCRRPPPPMIVGDGSLYTVTRMDPLFFLLTADRLLETTDASSAQPQQQWQPLEQIMDTLMQHDATLVSCLKSNIKQLNHLYDELNHGGGVNDDNDDDDDDSECFYKFSITKALVWLTRKQQAVQQVLLQQQMKAEQKKKNGFLAATAASPSAVGGSFCSTFNMIPDQKDIMAQKKSSATTVSVEQLAAEAALRAQREEERRLQRQESRARDESIQIVCNYLDDASWKGAFLKHLHVLSDAEADKVLWGKTTSSSSNGNYNVNNKRPASTIAASSSASTSSIKPSGANSVDKSSSAAATAGGSNANKKPRQTAKSAGVKRLEKAAGKKEKGLQKMTSFFTAIPKKKTNEENNVNDKK
jgi:hypothetical protein